MALGLSEDGYLDLTFGQIRALMDAWDTEQERIDARFALVAAVMANSMGAKKHIDDFMPPRAWRKKVDPDDEANYVFTDDARLNMKSLMMGKNEKPKGVIR